jgi:hypothetical protein
MAFALFRKPGPDPAAPALAQAAPRPMAPDSAKEILELLDGPVRVGGRHWGGFRTACKL